ncbi:MAG: glutamate--tRNA ligase [Candidatus Hinthialibacter antarcticus]|nr:glutamate--tRNA ligase [Candidatus Hinthialibacter antarcticus]
MTSQPVIRVRFAPSPTGNPHVGNFRTALYNYLYARNKGGLFLLRVEDTDKERSKDEYVDAILESLNWMGLPIDEPPVFQSKNAKRHQDEALRMIEEGNAYRCRCSSERIDQMRQEQQAAGQTARYDGLCREANHPDDGTPFCVRLKVPSVGVTQIHDMVRGEIVKQNEDMDDLVLLRTDGAPTYNLAVVVDDFDMQITHVMRGDDHINNTLRQVVIGTLLGYPTPQFIHLPQILGPDKTRLSKRHGAAGVLEYREQGYLPEALVNYLARLGWGHGDQEYFTPNELVKLFGVENLNKSAAVFDAKKLEWLNGEHIRQLTPEDFITRFKTFAAVKSYLPMEFITAEENDALFKGIAEAVQERSHTLEETWEKIQFLFNDELEFPEKESKKFFTSEAMAGLGDLAKFAASYPDAPPNKEAWEAEFGRIMETRDLKMKVLAQAVRIGLTGSVVSPPIFNVLELLGCEKIAARLNRAVQYAETMESE